MGSVMFFLFVVIFIGALVTAAVQHQRTIANWGIAARELDLNFNNESKWKKIEISGVLRGVHVSVRGEQRGSGEATDHYTVYRVTYPVSAGQPVSLRRESSMSTLKRMVGAGDVKIGDPGFDSRVEIRAGSPADAIAFLTPTRRMAVLSLFENYPMAEVTSGSVTVEQSKAARRPEVIVSTVRRLVDMALVMSAPELVDRALQLESDGELGAGVDALAELNASDDNLYTRLLEAEGRVAMGDRDTAAEILDGVAGKLPDDDEVDGWRRVAHTRPPPPLPRVAPPMPGPPDRLPATKAPTDDSAEPSVMSIFEALQKTAEPPRPEPTPPTPEPASDAAPVASTPVEPAPTPAPDGPANPLKKVSAQSLIDDLFASNRPSYEVEDHFSNVYRGAQVTWAGPVEKLRDYRSDRDFGDEPGLKATVTVGHLGDGQLVSDRIDAVVQLPADTAVERNDDIAFTGTLLRVDRFMRNVYVADARLV